MSSHAISDLYQMQALPLKHKITMTQQRIRGFYDHYDGEVYLSFSGGKDSTVLADIIDKMGYKDIPLVYFDTGLEYPEVREFVKTYGDRVTWVKPKKNFKDIITKYGYPFISKEVADVLEYSKKYLKKIYAKGMVTCESSNPNLSEIYESAKKQGVHLITRTQIINGEFIHKEKGVVTNETSKRYDYSKYKFLLEAPFDISSQCCAYMKKEPSKRYHKETGKNPITAQMASESRLRTQMWLRHGCNAFDLKTPMSSPMMFWTEQDVLTYIRINNIPIASVYGDIIPDPHGVEGQMSFADLGLFEREQPLLCTTGCDRTGCSMCGFGYHIEKRPSRFEVMEKLSSPQLLDYMMRGGRFDNGKWIPSNDGLGYWFVLKWMNVHGNMDMFIPYYEKYEEKYGNEVTRKYLCE